MTWEFEPWLLLLYFAYVFLVLVALVQMLYQRRSPQNLMAWLLTLLLLPYIGILLYLFFGSRKIFYRRTKPSLTFHESHLAAESSHLPALAQQINRLLGAEQMASLSTGNQVALFYEDHTAYLALLKAVEQAHYSIYLETYILQADATGRHLLEALTLKARQGVQVCLLLDAIGSFALYVHPKPLAAFRAAGGHVAFFQPVFKNFFNSQMNLRNHRKLYLFDHHVAFTGGMNLANDYLGLACHRPEQGRWQDLLFALSGPVLAHYHQIFQQDWRYASAVPLREVQPFVPQSQNVFVQAIPAGPDIEKEGLFESLMLAIYSAQRELVIVSPYFIPDGSIMTALLLAIKRGVRMRLLSPERSDHRIFDIGRSSYLRELAEAGGEIHFYAGKMLHAKLVVVDAQALLFGTANLDYRSLFINHELANWVYDAPLITQCLNWIEQIQAQSVEYVPTQGRGRRLWENLSRVIAPIL